MLTKLALQFPQQGDPIYIGAHIHNLDGTGQNTALYAATNAPAQYEVQVRNTSPDGAPARTVRCE